MADKLSGFLSGLSGGRADGQPHPFRGGVRRPLSARVLDVKGVVSVRKQKRRVTRKSPEKTVSAPRPASLPGTADPKPRIRRIPAFTLTGRSEEADPGAKGIRKLQESKFTRERPAFDPFDARAKSREADWAAKEGLELMRPPEGKVLRGCGEAILPDLEPGGLSREQRSLEIAIVDTLENPSMANLGASQLRLEAVAKLGIMQPAIDAVESAQAANSLEKMLCHQMTALHHVGMDMLARGAGAGALRQPEDALRIKYAGMAARCFDTYREGMLALLKFKTGGKQTVVVQHVTVTDGGQAVVAGSIQKSGGSGSSGQGGEGQK